MAQTRHERVLREEAARRLGIPTNRVHAFIRRGEGREPVLLVDWPIGHLATDCVTSMLALLTDHSRPPRSGSALVAEVWLRRGAQFPRNEWASWMLVLMVVERAS